MPVQIADTARSFNDPTGLLSDCHRRIEMFMRSLGAVANALDSPATEESRRALETALRYFREAAPKHTADEEESLFPRLRAVHSSEVDAAFSNLDQLEDDHRWAETLHARVETLGLEYLSRGELTHEHIEDFRSSVAQLSTMYQRHIAVEDGLLFPLAEKTLSDAEKQEIAREMASRRAVPLVKL
jgi:hemerythrin-like domain-containing protein